MAPCHRPLGAYFAGFTFKSFMIFSGKPGFMPERNQNMIFGHPSGTLFHDFHISTPKTAKNNPHK